MKPIPHDIELFRLERHAVAGIAPKDAAEALDSLQARINESENSIYAYFDGFFIEHLLPEKEEDFRAIAKSKNLKILAGLYFEPDIRLCSTEELAQHIKLHESFWKRMGAGQLRGACLPQPKLAEALVSLFIDAGFEFLVANEEAFNLPQENVELTVSENNISLYLATIHDNLFRINVPGDSLPQQIATTEMFDSATNPNLSPLIESTLLASYREDIRGELQRLPTYISENPMEFANNERLERAISWYLRSQHRGEVALDVKVDDSIRLRAHCFNSLLHSQVEIDSIFIRSLTQMTVGSQNEQYKTQRAKIRKRLYRPRLLDSALIASLAVVLSLSTTSLGRRAFLTLVTEVQKAVFQPFYAQQTQSFKNERQLLPR